jgi:predicted membrane protein
MWANAQTIQPNSSIHHRQLCHSSQNTAIYPTFLLTPTPHHNFAPKQLLQPSGCTTTINRIMARRKIIGIIFISVALIKFASIWNIFHLDWFDWLWQHPWSAYIAPALLLFIGVRLIVSSYQRNPDQWLKRPIPQGEDGKRIACAVRFGGDEYIYKGEAFHGARLDAFFGGIRLDLRQAVITEDEEIDIHTFAGGVELLVPANVNIEVKSRSFIGGVGNETCGRNVDGAHCLHIVASNFLGGVSIKN